MIRCPICREVLDSSDLRRHLHTHSTLALLRYVWAIDWRFTLLTLLCFAGVTGLVTWYVVVWLSGGTP